MISRIVLILLFTLQPALLQAGSLRAAPTGECAMPGCGEPVEVVSCCGLRVVQTHCGSPATDCDCGMAPGEPAPSPETPLPSRDRDGVQISWLPAPVVEFTLPPAHVAHRPVSQSRRFQTHNETQAILCIWQT